MCDLEQVDWEAADKVVASVKKIEANPRYRACFDCTAREVGSVCGEEAYCESCFASDARAALVRILLELQHVL